MEHVRKQQQEVNELDDSRYACSVFPKIDIYVFDDVLPGEVKKEYFARKKLGESVEYLTELYKLRRQHSRGHYSERGDNLVPVELGGSAEWTQTYIDVPGLRDVQVREPGEWTGVPSVPEICTTLTKAKFFALHPPTAEYIRWLHFRKWGKYSTHTLLDNLIPPELCNDNWVPDYTAKNAEQLIKNIQAQAEWKARDDAARERKKERAKEAKKLKQ